MDESNSDENVKEAVKKHLESNGILEKVRSMLRAETYKSLIDIDNDQLLSNHRHHSDGNDDFDNQEQNSNPLASSNSKMKQPYMNAIIDHMIIEYLQFNGLIYSLSTFQSESSTIGNYGVNGDDERPNENVISHGNQSERFKVDGESHSKCHNVRRELIKLDLGLSTQQDADETSTQMITLRNDNPIKEANDSDKIPLLYNIIEGLVKSNHDRQTI